MTFFEAGDPNLHDKIAKLKAKRGAQSGKQRVDEFLEKELHVDPRDLPFDLAGAEARMKEIMDANGSEIADVQGNSLGLKAVVFRTRNYGSPTNGCPNCGAKNNNGHWDDTHPVKGVGDWSCYDCDEVQSAPLPDTTVKAATEKDHGGEDWHDLKRCWTAYVKHLPVTVEGQASGPDSVIAEQVTVYSFISTKDWRNASTGSVVPVDPEPDPAKYPTGATLRIQKATFNGGDMDVERMYVRIGGLWSDDDIVALDTMQPIDPSGWTVVEVL